MESKRSALVVAWIALCVPAAASAVPPEDRCEAQKLKTSGVYAACRLKADARAQLRGGQPDSVKRGEKLARKWQRVEERAGAGVCPTAGDEAEIRSVVDEATEEIAEQLSGPDPGCPAGLLDRLPHEVVGDAIAALNAGDGDLLACQYHPEAFLVADQGILVGPAEIVDYLLQFPALFQAPLDVSATDVFRDTVRVLYEIDGGWIVVDDGTDTFLVLRGRIRRHTQHALIRFTGPPPNCPASQSKGPRSPDPACLVTQADPSGFSGTAPGRAPARSGRRADPRVRAA